MANRIPPRDATAALNKAPSAIYYYNSGIWKKVGAGNTDVGNDVIPAGYGFIIRKYQSGTGATASWTNPPTYGVSIKINEQHSS